MTWIILLILKVIIACTYIKFICHVVKNLKTDSTLHFSIDFISLIEVASVSAISIICLLSSFSIGSEFISIVALIDIIILYFEGKRVILIGEKSIQIREELVLIKDIVKIRTSLWTLYVVTKSKEIKVMNPLVTSWKFQDNVYKKIEVKS